MTGRHRQMAVVADDLRKSYGDIEAVRGVSFEVAPGEIFGLLGPNGAGKSTTINMLCTLVAPTGGTATVAGHDVTTDRDAVRRSIGLVFQESTLDGYLTAKQNLRFHAELYGVPCDEIAERIDEVLEMVGLSNRRSEPVERFSGGMKRRLEIARGLMHSPAVLFLDEPTVGLDPQTRAAIWGYISRLCLYREVTIVMTTHYLDEAEACDRIAIVDHGTVVALDTPQALKARVGADRVQIRTGDNRAAVTKLAATFDVDATVRDGWVQFAVPHGEEFVPRLFAELGVPIRSVQVSRPSLDDVFLKYTGTTIREDGPASSKLAANRHGELAR